MTAPTRRQIMAGSLAAVGAAGAPAIAIAADPEERVRLAVQELRDAMRARWPERHECFVDRSEIHNGAAAVMVAAVRPQTEDEVQS